MLARQEVAAELGDLQAPISAAPAPADAAAVESEAVPQAAEVAAAAAQKAAVAAALAAAAGDFVAAAADPFGFATPDASTQAALDAARRARAAADGAGSADKPGFRGMLAAELAAARAAVQTRLDALIKVGPPSLVLYPAAFQILQVAANIRCRSCVLGRLSVAVAVSRTASWCARPCLELPLSGSTARQLRASLAAGSCEASLSHVSWNIRFRVSVACCDLGPQLTGLSIAGA